jgi:hypothetical protein
MTFGPPGFLLRADPASILHWRQTPRVGQLAAGPGDISRNPIEKGMAMEQHTDMGLREREFVLAQIQAICSKKISAQ